ncbi:trypsin-like peptidase domain-containing protein [Candidatus Woesearchaeota archaeon]|nr:trypsin-like peptidase domain-containing protein [Candidatus Woesearchaeota archaeon]
MDYSSLIEKIRNSIAIVYVVQGQNMISKGSGFIFFKKGILVTCNHVITKQDSNILIQFPDDRKILQTKVMIRDEEHDLALLKFDDQVREPLKIADTEIIKEGIPVVFAGYPLSLESLTTHQGILSGIITDATGVTTYMIDGTVNSGNSGCPLMSEDGKVIGVVNAKRMEHSDLLTKIGEQKTGAVSLQGVDLVELFQAIINNVQLGIGYAIPCTYVPRPHGVEQEDIAEDKNE